MQKLRFSKRWGISAAVSMLLTLSCAIKPDSNKVTTTDSKPNIIVIISDDQGYADIGAMGIVDDIATPSLDSLAEQGTRFSNAYVTAPICNVSRLGLITGTYNQRQGSYWYGKKATISPKLTTIPETLKTAGYQTGYVGKYHYGVYESSARDFPLNHGFDFFYGYGGNGRQHFMIHNDEYDQEQRNKLKAYKKRGGKHGQALEYGAFWDGFERDNREGFSTEIYGEKARDFVTANKDKPFYLQLAFTAVHNFTHQLPEGYLKKNGLKGYHDWDPDTEDYYTWYKNSRYPNNPEGRAHYRAHLEYMDTEIGKLLTTLKEQGLSDNTIIFFVSDNGGSTPIYANNGPLRGSKYLLYEGGIRIPMLVMWPGNVEANKVKNNIVSTMDIFPTLAELAGVQAPSHVDGQSIVKLLKGEDNDLGHDTLFWDTGHETAVRSGNWKLKTATTDSYAKYEMVDLELGTFLYNLADDPAEAKDLSKQHPEIVEQLKAKYQDWKKDIKKGL